MTHVCNSFYFHGLFKNYFVATPSFVHIRDVLVLITACFRCQMRVGPSPVFTCWLYHHLCLSMLQLVDLPVLCIPDLKLT